MELLHNAEHPVKRGRYQFAGDFTIAGTATLQIKLEGGDVFQDMTNGTWAANEDGIIELSKSTVRVVITGSARFFLGIVETGR